MTLLLIIAVIVIVPWVAVVALVLSVLRHAAFVGARIDAIATPPASARPCPLCKGDDILVDPDGISLCVACHCSALPARS
jgi:hypothetical protein